MSHSSLNGTTMSIVPSPAAELSLPTYGLLGSTWAFAPVPLGRTVIKVSRSVAANVEYLEPPFGIGLEGVRWERDRATEPPGYMFKANATDLTGLISLEDWRTQLQSQFPDRMISDSRSSGTKQVTNFARKLFKMTSDLHAAGWRLGLLHPKSVYLRPSDPAQIILPDLGFAWLGTIEAVKPHWLKDETEDAAWWGENRLHRQYAAPAHVKRHPKAVTNSEFIQQDLHNIAQLLKYLVTGSVAATLPAECPLGQVVAKVGREQYATADAMRDDLLERLRAPVELTVASRHKTQKSIIPIIAGLAIALIAVLGLGVYLLYKPKPVDTEIAIKQNTEPPKPITPAIIPTDPTTIQELVDGIDKSKTLEEAARAAARLAAKDPNHPKVAQTREKLLTEIRATWIIAQKDGHVPGRSMILNDLYKQLTPPKPQ